MTPDPIEEAVEWEKFKSNYLTLLEKAAAWEPWFAWRPVLLLTLEWAWLRTVVRRPAIPGQWSYGAFDYANP